MTPDHCEFCDAPLIAWRDSGNYRKYACGARRRWCSCHWSIVRTRRCRRATALWNETKLRKKVDALAQCVKEQGSRHREHCRTAASEHIVVGMEIQALAVRVAALEAKLKRKADGEL